MHWSLPLILAHCVGSFLGVLILRLPRGEDWIWQRSACPSCGTQLRPLELTPFLSWLFALGRCRHCAARIPLFYPGVELAALVVAASAAAALDG